MRKAIGMGFVIMLLLTGCWDKVEIDKRIFVTSIGIDKFEKGMAVKNAAMLEASERNRYVVTFMYPNTGLIAGKGEGEPQFTVSGVGENLYDIQKILTSRLEGDLNFDHTKLIAVGESLARDEEMMREVLDIIERSPEIGRRIHFMITPGKAANQADTKPSKESVLGLYVRDLMMQQRKLARTIDADMGYILRTLHESKATVVPRIIFGKEDIKIAGAGVLKDYKLVGWLNEIEAKNLMMLLDKVKVAEANVRVNDRKIAIAITDSSTRKRVYKKEDGIYAAFDIEMEGAIGQHLFAVKGEVYNMEFVQKIEQNVEQDTKKSIERTFKKIQKEYQADLIQAGEYLRKFAPDTWEQVKGRWDEVFPEMKLVVNVDMKIRRIGVTR